ncbi:MAG: hypothetical protein ABJG78_15435 [Cyclobacteriaceae bacterium]
MKALFALLAILLTVATVQKTPELEEHSVNYQYSNGQWFDGKKFVKKTMYSVSGVWVAEKPANIDSIFDLENNFILPPFSEVHTHALDGIGHYKKKVEKYLNDGVFYVKNPNNIKPWTENLKPEINGPSKLDGSFANGGLTSTGGHPEILYEDRIREQVAPYIDNAPRGWFKNKSYFNIDSERDLNDQWPLIMEGKPDFIKLYLANSEDIGNTPPATKYSLRKGLHPSLVPPIVKKAHQAGLRVSAHVETRVDFVTALNAGVDEITHTPGFYLFSKNQLERYRLTKEDAKLAARKGVFVVTALLSRNLTEDPELMPLVKEMQAFNLSLLSKSKVKIAIGGDHAPSPWAEVLALQELDIFSNQEILKMWCEISPQTIFPNRKLGLFKTGYEASFIGLEADPLLDLSSVTKVTRLVKQGHPIEKKIFTPPITTHSPH